MNRLWVLVISMCVFIMGVGCHPIETLQSSNNVSPKQVSTSHQEPRSENYLPSDIEPEFPVPKQAQKTNHQSKKPATEYVRYTYQNLTDPKVRNTYFAEIRKWGWIEQKEEQMGSMHLFTKGEKRIQMTVHQAFFTLFLNKSR